VKGHTYGRVMPIRQSLRDSLMAQAQAEAKRKKAESPVPQTRDGRPHPVVHTDEDVAAIRFLREVACWSMEALEEAFPAVKPKYFRPLLEYRTRLYVKPAAPNWYTPGMRSRHHKPGE